MYKLRKHYRPPSCPSTRRSACSVSLTTAPICTKIRNLVSSALGVPHFKLYSKTAPPVGHKYRWFYGSTCPRVRFLLSSPYFSPINSFFCGLIHKSAWCTPASWCTSPCISAHGFAVDFQSSTPPLFHHLVQALALQRFIALPGSGE